MNAKGKNIKPWVALSIATLIGLLAGSILTRTNDLEVHDTIKDRRAAEYDQELRDSIDAEVKEALKDLP